MIVVFSLNSCIFAGRAQCEVSVVIAGLVGGRDRAVEARRGGCEARRSFPYSRVFYLLSLLYQTQGKSTTLTLVFVYSSGVERKVFYLMKNLDEHIFPWNRPTCEISLIG